MKPLVISFSGGRTSAYMTWFLLEKYKGKREILVVFANTGKEREETLQFVHDCDTHFIFNTVWIEGVTHEQKGKGQTYKVVDFHSCSRNGEPFEAVISKFGIPNPGIPKCSNYLKAMPISRYLKDKKIKDYDHALGIRYDEPKRLKTKPKIYYPLATEFPTTKKMVNKWWAQQAFNLNLKGYEGNCDLCWKKSKRKLLTIILERPELTDWWNEMEIKYQHVNPMPTGEMKTFYRNKESMQDLIQDSKFPFVKASDDFTLAQLMHSEPELDFTNGCEESCEAF